MFQNWMKFLLMKCAGSALKCSETQVRVSYNYNDSSLPINFF